MRGSSTRFIVGALLGLAACVLLVVILSSSGGSEDHRLKVVIPDATGLIAGQEVRMAGSKVGAISRVRAVRGGDAVEVELRVEDRAWPLPERITMHVRTGGTVSFVNRYVDLRRPAPGQPQGAMLREGDVLPAARFQVPVEFDEFVGTFTTDVRADLKQMLDAGGVNLRAAGPHLRRALVDGPETTEQLAGVFADIADEHRALGSLVRHADRVVASVRSADPGLRTLLDGAGATFDELATDARSVQETLDTAPPVLAHTRKTLRRADGTLAVARDVTSRLAPGVTELRRTASPLNAILKAIPDVAPDARAALVELRRAAPDLNPLLDEATDVAPELGSIGKQATTELKCLRPYTPEIVGFFPAWGDMLSSGDGRDKYLRANVQVFLPAPHNVSDQTSGQLAKQFPGLRYGFPRPPGTIAGQPWFLPECGAGPDALDPSKDPESRNFNTLMQLPPELSASPGRAKR